MSIYYTKERLYKEIHIYKQNLGFNKNDFGFDLISHCVNTGIQLEKVPFKTKGLRGMAIVGEHGNNDIILLNSSRNNIEQNFDCGHEVIHLGIHRKLKRKTFNCIDKVYAKQDTFIEWQANEGAAELFVPYEVLLPLIKKNSSRLNDGTEIALLKYELADLFKVTTTVISYRFESLKYEIQQYINGVNLQDLKILSLSQQKENKIYVKSLNDIEDEYFNKMLKEYKEKKHEEKTRKTH